MKKAFSARDVLILSSQIPHIKPVQGYTQRGTFLNNTTNKNASFQVSQFGFFFRRLFHGAVVTNDRMINEWERIGKEAVAA